MIIGKAISPFSIKRRTNGGGGGNDADAQAFITASGISGTNATAINTLVIDLKAANIWTKMKCIYPFVGNTASTQKWNLKDARDLDAAYRLVFSGGFTFSATGCQPNGTNAYANTFFQPSNFTAYPNCSFGYYSRTNIDNGGTDIGANQLDIYSNLGATAYVRTASGTFTTFSVTNSLGFVMGSRLNTATQKAYKNGVLKATTAQTAGTSFLFNIYIGATNSSGIASFFSNRQCAFAYLSDGLTDAEALAFYNAVQTFNTTLGRQV
jgi:hypothetical protein